MPETMHPTQLTRIFVVTRRPFRSLRVNNATRLGARVGLGVSSPRRVRGGDRRVPRVRGFVGSMARVNGVGDQAGFATDLLPPRPLRAPFRCAFESPSEAAPPAFPRAPRDVVPIPAESGDDPITRTHAMLRAAATTWAWDAFAYAADAEYPLATLARFLIVHSGLASSLEVLSFCIDTYSRSTASAAN